MSEDMGDKTEAPTPKRRAEAREQGNIARSADLTAAALLVGTLMMLNWWGKGMVSAMRTLVAEFLGAASMGDFNPLALFELLAHSVWTVGRGMLPLLAGIVFVAVLANVSQVGVHFNTQRLQPNIAALNPFKGLKSIFSIGGGKGPMQTLMNLTKVIMVVFTGYSAVHARLGQILGVQYLDFAQIFGLGAGLIYAIAFRIGMLLLILAILDYAWQRYRIEKQLKMTKQEVKEEMRRMDGDPQIKQKRKQIAFQIATGQMKKAVPTADVVVTNPTEFAVAIKYDAENMHAPRVVAKGQGFMAAKIREIAIASGIPILERKPLARALYKMVEVGQEIPEEFYATVAEILAYVYELSGKIGRRKSA